MFINRCVVLPDLVIDFDSVLFWKRKNKKEKVRRIFQIDLYSWLTAVAAYCCAPCGGYRGLTQVARRKCTRHGTPVAPDNPHDDIPKRRGDTNLRAWTTRHDATEIDGGRCSPMETHPTDLPTYLIQELLGTGCLAAKYCLISDNVYRRLSFQQQLTGISFLLPFL